MRDIIICIVFASSTAVAQPVTIDSTYTYQTIDGFGGFQGGNFGFGNDPNKPTTDFAHYVTDPGHRQLRLVASAIGAAARVDKP